MSHYEQAERLVQFPAVNENGRNPHETLALTHAILALIDKLDEMPIMGFNVQSTEDA